MRIDKNFSRFSGFCVTALFLNFLILFSGCGNTVNSFLNYKATNSTVSSTPTMSGSSFIINENPGPVFSTLVADQCCVIKDNVNYKMYYTSDFNSLSLAQSSDGINWVTNGPVITNCQEHAYVKYYDIGFNGANGGIFPTSSTMNYRMWYQSASGAGITTWRYAESADGISWYNLIAVSQYGTPVYDAGWACYGIADAVYTPGAANSGLDWTFRIYANVQYAGGTYGSMELPVMAFSINGYEWTWYDPFVTGHATPVFTPSLVLGTFDQQHIGWFKVIKNNPTNWEAFYSGAGIDGTWFTNGIGYAVSADGISWMRRQTLFTTHDGVAWRSASVWMPSVVKTATGYQIWFIGSNDPMIDGTWVWWKVGMATLTYQ